MKKIFGVKKLLSCCLLASGIFMGNQPAIQAAENHDTLNFVNFRDIRDLNPHLYAGEMYAQEMLFETLIDITADGYKPCLAEKWDISTDGKVYTFTIRKGVKFSDGEPCDAYAIKANFDAIIENQKRHSWLEMMRLLQKVEAPDAQTFRIVMSGPYYPMLTELGVTRPFAMISPKAMKNGSTKDGVAAYIGTGPWVLKQSVTDEYAIFERNENYWGEKPKLKRIIVKVIPDNQTRIMALEKGEIDLIWGKNMLDADALNKYRSSKKFDIKLSEPTSIRCQHQPVAAGGVEGSVYFRKAADRSRGQHVCAEHGFFNLDDFAKRGKRSQKFGVHFYNAVKTRPLVVIILRFCQCQPGKRTNQGGLGRKPQVTCKESVRKHRMFTRLPWSVVRNFGHEVVVVGVEPLGHFHGRNIAQGIAACKAEVLLQRRIATACSKTRWRRAEHAGDVEHAVVKRKIPSGHVGKASMALDIPVLHFQVSCDCNEGLCRTGAVPERLKSLFQLSLSADRGEPENVGFHRDAPFNKC